jgi:superfamily I DNA/RNA helicase
MEPNTTSESVKETKTENPEKENTKVSDELRKATSDGEEEQKPELVSLEELIELNGRLTKELEKEYIGEPEEHIILSIIKILDRKKIDHKLLKDSFIGRTLQRKIIDRKTSFVDENIKIRSQNLINRWKKIVELYKK